MNFPYKFKKNLIHNLNNTIYIYNTFRFLENYNNNATRKSKNNELRDLYIYIAALAVVIIIILGGYGLYKKFVENKLIQELEQEYQNIIESESNSKSSSIKEIVQPYSYDGKKQNYGSGISSNNIQNNSFDFNHEERMEQIRLKYGNSLLIKILLNKFIEEVIYNTNFKEEYGDNCTICMNNFFNNMAIYKTPCEHIFHKECFRSYLNNIKKKEKLTCPNCNQNLLLNKRYLKLRIKSKKINIEKQDNNKVKESEIEIDDNKEIENHNNDITNKNNEKNINNIKDNNNTLIIIKKKKKEEKEFNNNNKNMKEINMRNNAINKNIFGQINDIDYKNTEILQSKELEDNKNIGLKKENKDEKETKNFFDNYESEVFNNKKDSVINLNIQKDKKLLSKKKVNIFLDDNIIHLSSNELNSQNDFIKNNKNILPTSKKDN